MALYSRILVTLDGTDIDLPMLEQVKLLAAMLGSTVVLLRVAHYHTRDSRTAEETDCQADLARAAARREGHGFEVETVLGRGEPAAEILRQSEAQHASLIAMGTHGHGRVSRYLYGSVSEQVRHSTALPLLLVRGHDIAG